MIGSSLEYDMRLRDVVHVGVGEIDDGIEVYIALIKTLEYGISKSVVINYVCTGYDLEVILSVKLAVAFEHNAHADLVIDTQAEFRAA